MTLSCNTASNLHHICGTPLLAEARRPAVQLQARRRNNQLGQRLICCRLVPESMAAASDDSSREQGDPRGTQQVQLFEDVILQANGRDMPIQ